MVKVCVYKPAQALIQVEVPRIARQLAHEGSMVVSMTHPLPLTPRQYPWYMFNRNIYQGYYLRLSGTKSHSGAGNIKLKKTL